MKIKALLSELTAFLKPICKNEAPFFLYALLFMDGILIALHSAAILAIHFGLNVDQRLLLSTEGGYGEWFKYVQEFCIFLLFLKLAVRSRQPIYGFFTMIFLYATADDSLQFHERAGDIIAVRIAPYIPLASGLDDVGEAIFLSLLGLLLVAPMFFVFIKMDSKPKKTSFRCFVLLCMFFFFAVAIDVLHGVFGSNVLHLVFGLIEGGGELISLSIICWFVFRLNKNATARQI